MNGFLRITRVCCLASIGALGCGGSSTATSGTTPANSSTTAAAASGGTPAAPMPDGSRRSELAMLRPTGSEAPLTALGRDPEDPAAYARAIAVYAESDVRGMVLLWGQTYRILASHGPKTVEVSEAMARVLRERVVTQPEGASPRVAVNFAPGEMPLVTMGDGRTFAPFAYLYQHSMTLALANDATDRTQYEGAVSYFSLQLGAICRSGRPVLDEELYELLCGLSAAGHRDTYAHWVIGPAFGPAFEQWSGSHAQELSAMRQYLAVHPYRPRRPTRADDLFPVRPRGS